MSVTANNKTTSSRQQYCWLAVVWLLVLVSALSVVFSVFDSRIKFNALELLRKEHNELQVSWGQYLLEESTWASYGRIEKIATEKLAMKIPEPKQIILVNNREN